MTVFSVAVTETMSRDLVPLAAVQSIPPYKTSRPHFSTKHFFFIYIYISGGYVSSVKKKIIIFFLTCSNKVAQWHDMSGLANDSIL